MLPIWRQTPNHCRATAAGWGRRSECRGGMGGQLRVLALALLLLCSRPSVAHGRDPQQQEQQQVGQREGGSGARASSLQGPTAAGADVARAKVEVEAVTGRGRPDIPQENREAGGSGRGEAASRGGGTARSSKRGSKKRRASRSAPKETKAAPTSTPIPTLTPSAEDSEIEAVAQSLGSGYVPYLSSWQEGGESIGYGVHLDENSKTLWAAALGSGMGSPDAEPAAEVSVVPSFLDWEGQPLCAPMASSMFIINTSNQTELLVQGIASNNMQFYPADFHPTTLPPNGRLLVSILFLPRQLGMAEGLLALSTSVGRILVHMYGHGVESALKLEPLVGMKVAVEQQLIHWISVHNPFDSPLRVLEAQTPEVFFSLQLPRYEVGQAGEATQQLNDWVQEWKVQVQDSSQSEEGTLQGPAWLWEVPPGQSRPVVELQFLGPLMGRYVGVVHMRIEHPEVGTENHMIPVDLSTIAGGDLHCSPDEVSFGTLTFPEQTVVRELALLNTGEHPLTVEEVVDLGTHSNMVEVKYASGTVLLPGVETPAAQLTYAGSFETRPGGAGAGRVDAAESWWQTGRLIVKTNDSYMSNLEVPYRARVMHGSLRFQPEGCNVFLLTSATYPAAAFARGARGDDAERHGTDVASPRPVVQEVSLVNGFPATVVLYAATPSDPRFEVLGFEGGVSLAPGGVSPAFQLKFTPEGMGTAPLVAHLEVATNLSQTVLALHVHWGRLEFTVPGVRSKQGREAGSRLGLAMGLVSVGHVLQKTFQVTNRAPKAIPILDMTSTLSEIVVEVGSVRDFSGGLVGGIGESDVGTTLLWQGAIPVPLGTPQPKSKPVKAVRAGGGWTDGKHTLQAFLYLQPGQTAVFTVQVSPKQAEAKKGVLEVRTPFETQALDVEFESLAGTVALSPSPLGFPPSFPGRFLRKRLYATSTFPCAIALAALTSSDPRIIPDLTAAELPPGVKTEIGSLVFDVSRAPAEDNYMGGSHGEPSGAGHVGRPGRPGRGEKDEGGCRGTGPERSCGWGPEVGPLEEQAMHRRGQVWHRLLASGGVQVEAGVVLHTGVVSSWGVSVKASLMRPQVIADTLGLNFSRVQVGSAVMQPVRVSNPSDGPIRMQLVVGPASEHNCTCGEGKGEPGPHCPIRQQPAVPPSGSAQRGWFNLGLASVPHHSALFSLAEGGVAEVVVPPRGEAVLGPIAFQPFRLCAVRGVLYVRNNLTRLESAPLTGEGGSGHLDFDQGEGPERRLHVNVSAAHLNMLEELEMQAHVRQLLVSTSGANSEWPQRVKRQLRAVNTGNLPLVVTSVSLVSASSRSACQARGFTLNPCQPFSLAPGQSMDFEVSFRPDFSASRVVQELTLATSAGLQHFPLVAQLPPELLPLCLEAMGSPSVEGLLRPLCLAGLTALLLLLTRTMLRDFTIEPAPWRAVLPPTAAGALAACKAASKAGGHHGATAGAGRKQQAAHQGLNGPVLAEGGPAERGTPAAAPGDPGGSAGGAGKHRGAGAAQAAPTAKGSDGNVPGGSVQRLPGGVAKAGKPGSLQQTPDGPVLTASSSAPCRAVGKEGGAGVLQTRSLSEGRGSQVQATAAAAVAAVAASQRRREGGRAGGSPGKRKGGSAGSLLGAFPFSAPRRGEGQEGAGPTGPRDGGRHGGLAESGAGEAQAVQSPRRGGSRQQHRQGGAGEGQQQEAASAGPSPDADETVTSPGTGGAAMGSPVATGGERDKKNRKKKHRHVAAAGEASSGGPGKGGDNPSSSQGRSKADSLSTSSPASPAGAGSPVAPSSPRLRPIKTKPAGASSDLGSSKGSGISSEPVLSATPAAKDSSKTVSSYSGRMSLGKGRAVAQFVVGRAGNGSARSSIPTHTLKPLAVDTASAAQRPAARLRSRETGGSANPGVGGPGTRSPGNKEAGVPGAAGGGSAGEGGTGSVQVAGLSPGVGPGASAWLTPAGCVPGMAQGGSGKGTQGSDADATWLTRRAVSDGDKTWAPRTQSSPGGTRVGGSPNSPASALSYSGSGAAGGLGLRLAALPAPYRPALGPVQSHSSCPDGGLLADHCLAPSAPQALDPTVGKPLAEKSLHKPPSFMDMKLDTIVSRPVSELSAPKRWSMPPLHSPGKPTASSGTGLGTAPGSPGGGLGLGGGYDTLGSIGKRSLEAEGELRELVYDIWGNHFAEIGAKCSTLTAPSGPELLPSGSSSLFAQVGFTPASTIPSAAVSPPLAATADHPPSPTSSLFSSSFAGFSIFSQGTAPAATPPLHGEPSWRPPAASPLSGTGSLDRTPGSLHPLSPRCAFPTSNGSLFASDESGTRTLPGDLLGFNVFGASNSDPASQGAKGVPITHATSSSYWSHENPQEAFIASSSGGTSQPSILRYGNDDLGGSPRCRQVGGSP